MTNSIERSTHLDVDMRSIPGLTRVVNYFSSNEEIFNKFSLVATRTLAGEDQGQDLSASFCPIRPTDFFNAFPNLNTTLQLAGCKSLREINPRFSLEINKKGDSIWKAVVELSDNLYLETECSPKTTKVRFKHKENSFKKRIDTFNLGTNIWGSSKVIIADIINYQYSALEAELQNKQKDRIR